MRFAETAPLDDAAIARLAWEWLALENRATLLVDRHLRLIWANRVAADLLANGGDLELRDGFVTMRNRAGQPDLLRFIADCGPDMATLCLPSNGGHLLLRAREVRSEGDARYFGLSFHHSANDFAPRYADLDRAFRLTAAEHRVLMRMIEGMTADEIATDSGQSIETVRSHIRSIYAKTESTSRESLFARIRPFRV